MKNYCTQNNGDCLGCSLVNNYGRDCHNNPIARGVSEGYCDICSRPIIYCEHGPNYHGSLAAMIARDRQQDPNRISQSDIDDFFGSN